jgi:hypothetical protein
VHANGCVVGAGYARAMADALLHEKRRWWGRWWLPENPEQKVAGVLTYKPEGGLRLRLIGGWEHRNITQQGGMTLVHEGMREWPMIHGQSENKTITLLNTFATRAKSYGWGMGDEPDELEVYVHTALVGCLLDEPEEAAFVSASAGIDNLTGFANRTGMEIKVQHSKDVYKGSLTVKAVKALEVGSGDFKVKLHHILAVPQYKRLRRETQAKAFERSTVEFQSGKPLPLNDLLDKISAIKDLVSLSTLSPCGEESVTVYLPATPEKYPEEYAGRDLLHDVQVYQRRIVVATPDAEGADDRGFAFTLNDISWEKLIPRWLEVADTFAAARSMVLGLRYVTGGYLESRLVTMVSAAESMHRAMNPDPPIPPDEFEALRKRLFEAVPDERRQWLSDRIANNEPTLRVRLLGLASRPGSFMASLLPNPEPWARMAARSRNDVAHVGSSSNHTQEQLHAVVRVTEAVVVLNLLSEAGVPEDRLARAITEHRDLRYAAKLATEHLSGA